MSRLCDRVTRRASPGLDTDLSGLGSGFIYPGNVRRKGLSSTAVSPFAPARRGSFFPGVLRCGRCAISCRPNFPLDRRCRRAYSPDLREGTPRGFGPSSLLATFLPLTKLNLCLLSAGTMTHSRNVCARGYALQQLRFWGSGAVTAPLPDSDCRTGLSNIKTGIRNKEDCLWTRLSMTAKSL